MDVEAKRQGNSLLNPWFLRLAALLASGGVLQGCWGERVGDHSGCRPRTSPAVSSDLLAKTEIVPTLDTPLPPSGNAIWCATFQVAWNLARDDIFRGPLRIANAEPVADRLERSPVTAAVLPPGSFFSAAGRLQDGIAETIRREMSRQFAGAELPEFDGAVGFVTYGYLDTKAAFTTPFMDTKQPIQFSDAAGVMHSVRGFGLHEGTDWDLLDRQAAQVKVLFSQADDESDRSEPIAFALDLTADQPQQQVIVAVLPRAKHLRAALDELAKRIVTFAPDEYSVNLDATDTLAIPNVAFHVNHEFPELQGVDKTIENPGEFHGLYILKAAQSIKFRLDKSGATVVSESHMRAAAIPRDFVVDRPFLIVMKCRSADEPFFVAWIEDVELLENE